MNKQYANTHKMENGKRNQSLENNVPKKKGKTLKATAIALLTVLAAGSFPYSDFGSTEVAASEYNQEATDSQQNVNAITDPAALRAIEGFVADWHNQPVIGVGERAKPTAAVWCQGAMGMCKTYSSNPEVVTVDDNGVVTGIAPGNAYIVYVAMGSLTECYQYIVV